LDWHLEAELPFRNEVVDGLTVRRSSPDATDDYLSPRIFGAIRRARPDVMISGGFSFPSLYAVAYGRACSVPLLIHSDGTSDWEARLGAEQRFARRLFARLAWGAVGNSEPAARRFVEIGFPATRVFRALHTTQIEPFWRVAEGRTTATDGPLRLLFVGRLVPRKGVALLLRAVARANGEGVDVKLTVVGTGPEDVSLKTLARDLGVAVTWRGFIDQSDLLDLYADADAFVFPTLGDTFGIVLLEAAASGLPLIASPHGGATEDLVEHGVNGWVVDPLDTPAMTAAIVRLAKDADLRARLGRAAHEATRDRTPDAMADGYLTAVRAAHKERRR
jgi:glycosyltransferase involved in cell wall biosynthesis